MTESFECHSPCISGLVSRNISILNRRTSVRLEPEIWQALGDIAKREQCNVHLLCSLIAKRKRPENSLTAAIRIFVMLYFRAAATEDGHARAGHGSLAKRAQGMVMFGVKESKILSRV
jgi:predicted DNA-binding ribbon-helix-helix protein